MSANPLPLRLPPMPKIADILRIYGLSAKKQLSQNFILDLNVTDKIARVSDVFDCHVCEVGAGPGSLTRSLLRAGAKHVGAVEIDGRFLPSLEMLQSACKGRLSIHRADIMTFYIPEAFPNASVVRWESNDLPGVRMVGNLPFNVSIPLLLQWLEAIPMRAGPFAFGRTPMALVFQKEVADNIRSSPGSTECTRLSIMTQHLCEVKKKYSLPRKVFLPEPKVNTETEFVRLSGYGRFSFCDAVVDEEVKHENVAFNEGFSTNMLIFSLPFYSLFRRTLFPRKPELVDELMERTGIDSTLRPHQVDFKDYNKICQSFLELARDHELSVTPLRVRKPVAIATASNKVEQSDVTDDDMEVNFKNSIRH
ncbi:PREDICTED: mitochondrial dimethyladenosine transferase 1-like [Acropora digitifera]|uniref:mitochondrial dimethyladenosine transferase 1-like n=1 Tax=Acropora digitifera TaxID=70779 RepID=UPI00077A9A39|nr:PREDICTED: mitochondrial dimethyladenosine transferase 1-like [Acropora digitifera]